jgi:hypothetical protein
MGDPTPVKAGSSLSDEITSLEYIASLQPRQILFSWGEVGDVEVCDLKCNDMKPC